MSHTLLLADDSVTIQRVIELTFADEDVRVVAVSDGGEAIALLNQSPPDIVLADVGMPGQNGYEVARHIKSTPRLAGIPVVLLTGAFEPIDQARVAEVGCDGVLAKPFEPQLVIAKVKELLARPRGAVVQPWVAPAEEPHELDAPTRTPADMDNYFDRLDAALSNLAGSSQPRSPRSERRDNEWFDAIRDPKASPESDAIASEPAAHPAAVAGQSPSLSDAFAALLVAEQSAQGSAGAADWPMPRQGLTAADTHEIVEEVTRRVLGQLSDRVIREAVSDIVSATAEKMVREEIDRIKRQIE